MPRLVTPLTDSKIKNAKIQSKDYSLSDGDGLYLLIKKQVQKYGVLIIIARLLIPEH